MKLIWISDPHLEFLSLGEVDTFLRALAGHRPDAFLITADISTASFMRWHLTDLALSFSCPIYFTLGNQDFYGGSFDQVDGLVHEFCATYPQLIHLGHGEIITLNAETVLIGHRGWADGRAGLGRRSTIRLKEERLIEDLTDLDTDELFQRLGRLGDESADYIRALVSKVLSQAKHLIVATHVPPFESLHSTETSLRAPNTPCISLMSHWGKRSWRSLPRIPKPESASFAATPTMARGSNRGPT